MEHRVKILEARYISHDVKQFRVERPSEYEFVPGQATDVSLTMPGWENELRPFTFTSLPGDDHLEFTIKIYSDHEGVTNKLGSINSGSELILHDVFGAISFKGPGVFLAGGAGVTPFIAILRDLRKRHALTGNTLIFSNKSEEDIILKDEFTAMLGDRFITVLTRDHVIGFRDKRIDKDFLVDTVADFSQHFYVCGPDAFVRQMGDYLLELGVSPQSLVVEQ